MASIDNMVEENVPGRGSGNSPEKDRRCVNNLDSNLPFGGFQFWQSESEAPTSTRQRLDQPNPNPPGYEGHLHLAKTKTVAEEIVEANKISNGSSRQTPTQTYAQKRKRDEAEAHDFGTNRAPTDMNGAITSYLSPNDEHEDVEDGNDEYEEDKTSYRPVKKHRKKAPYKNAEKYRRGRQMGKAKVPDEIHPGLMKYWLKRRMLFSKYDHGIKLDAESWYSVTPEALAIHTAKKCAIKDKATVIVDAFCGCGGNTIQFAKYCKKVIAIDIDPIKIEYAKHNAEIYGVRDNIEFIVGDFLALAPILSADVVFLSPPWGGPSYSFFEKFDLKTMIPMNGFDVFSKALTISRNVAYFLPKNIDKDQLDELALAHGIVSLEIESNITKHHVKAKTIYVGDLCYRKVKTLKQNPKSKPSIEDRSQRQLC